MEPRWSGSYDVVLVYQEFLLLLIALIGALACLGALASLLFVWRECFAGFSGPTGGRFTPISAGQRQAAPDDADFSTCVLSILDDSLVVLRDAGTEDVCPLDAELGDLATRWGLRGSDLPE